jgi:hypothetical protein
MRWPWRRRFRRAALTQPGQKNDLLPPTARFSEGTGVGVERYLIQFWLAEAWKKVPARWGRAGG